MWPPTACFRLDGVQVLRGERLVLQIPALSLPGGETTAVVGPSGAGKSTLLRLLAGLETPASGEVRSWGPHGGPLRPGEVVMVFQRPVLVKGTVEENVMVGLRFRRERDPAGKVQPLLERLGLDKKSRQQVRTLSGGEYQRVALARALALRPAALLLDEPTASLDPQNVALIEALVGEARKETGMTVVWVTHHPFQARRVGRSALLLLDGRLVEHSDTQIFFSESADPRTRDFLAGRMVW